MEENTPQIDLLKMHGLADDQLTAADLAAAKDQLNSCDRSRSEYEAIVSLKGVLKDHCQGHFCEETWAKCQGRLNELDKTRRTENFVTKYAWGICGAFLVAIVGASAVNRTQSGQSLNLGDVNRVSANMSAVSPDADSIKGWIKNLIGRGNSAQADSKPAIVAARKGVLGNRPALQVVLQDPAGQMVLTMVRGTNRIEVGDGDGEASAQRGKIGQMNCVTWVHNDVGCILVGSRTHADLETAMTTIQERIQ